MSKILKVLVNTGKQETQKIFDVIQGAGAKGKPTIIKAELGARYELQDPDAKGLGPSNIQSKRVGKHKHVLFDDNAVADLIIEDYYEDGMASFGDSGVYGRAEDGKLYEYIVKDSVEGLPVDLVDGGKPLTRVLGGNPANDVFMVGSAPAVAFSGINALFAAAGTTGAVAAAAASDGSSSTEGGSDGGGGGGDTTAPTGQTGKLAVISDTGTRGDNITNSQTPTIDGQAEPGATVQVTLNGKTYTTTANATTGAYSVSVPVADALPSGSYTPSIKVTDAAGNSSTVAGTAFTVDTNAPTGQIGALTATAPNDSGALGDNLTRTTTPQISGTAEAGAAVEVTLNGKTYTTTANATTGAYSVTVPAADALPSGSYTPSIKVTDAAGNSSAVAGTPFTVDASAPAGQTGALTATAPNDSGTLGDNLTSTNTPQISGTAEPGSAVEVTLNGKTYSTTANATSGAYSVTVPAADALPSGSYTPSIKVTDAAGNSSTVSGTPFTVDTSAPTGQTGALAAASDTGVRNHITSNTTPEISGKTEPDATVEVSLNGKNYTTTANSTGDYSITVPPDDALPNGTYTPSIKVTDAAGNSSTVAGTAFTVDRFSVAISAVETDLTDPVEEQFETPTFNAGVWTTNYLSMAYFAGSTLVGNQIQNVDFDPADVGFGMRIGASNTQNSAKDRSLVVNSKIGPFSDLSFVYRDFQDGPDYSGLPAATVEFLDAAGVVIDSQAFVATTNSGQKPTFDWVNASALQAASFRIVGMANDSWRMDKLIFSPMAGSLPSGSTTTDTSHTLRGTLDTALSDSQVVEIFNGTTSLGDATVTGTTWTFDVPASTFATQTYTAQVKDGTQVLSTSNAFTLIVASTPLVLDLNGDGVQTIGISEGVQFDLLNTGTPQSVGWVDRHDGLLAIDLNGDGHINSGAELFGDHTQLSDGSLAKDGWHALAEMDSNADGQINALDVNFDRLLLWVDANSNGISDAGELSGLAAANIASIDLAANTHSVQQNGNVVQAFSTYTTLDGRTLEVADVGFQVNPAVFASHGMDAVQPLVDTAMLNASRPML